MNISTLLLSAVVAFAQSGGGMCYSSLVEAGNELLNSPRTGENKYQQAIKLFEAARACPDLTPQQDSAAVQLIYKANDSWRSETESLYQQAKEQQERLAKQSDSIQLQYDQLEQKQIELEQQTERALYNVRVAEASRLAFLAGESTEQGDAFMAISLSSQAVDSLPDNVPDSTRQIVDKAFGDAVFLNYATHLPQLQSGILGITYSANGDRYTEYSLGGDVVYFEKDRRAYGVNNKATVYHTAMGPSTGHVAVSADGSIRQWNGEGVRTDSFGLAYPVTLVSYAPDGSSFITADRGYAVRLWTGSADEPVILAQHAGPVEQIAFSGNGRYVMSRSLDKTIKLTNLYTQDVVSLKEDMSFISGAGFLSDEYLVFGTTAGTIKSYNLNDGTTKLIGDLKAPLSAMCVRSGPGDIVVAAMNGDINVFSPGQVGAVHYHEFADTWVKKLVSDPEGKSILALTNNGEVFRFDESLRAVAMPLFDEEGCSDLAISPDGTQFAVISGKNQVALHKLNGSQVMTPNPFDGEVWCLGFSPDGRFLFAGSSNGEAWTCRLPSLMLCELTDCN